MTSVPEEPFTAQQFGITNPLGNLFPGMPTISVTGLFVLGSSPLADQSSRINSFGLQDTLSIVHGRHRLKVGGEYRRSQVNFYFNAFSRGQLIFPTFTNFLLGQSVSIIGSGVYDRAFRVNDLNGFVQDDLKLTDRLTLNLGLRYDFYGLPKEKYGRLVNFIPEQFRSGTLASPAGSPNGFVQAGNAVNPLPDVPLVEDTLVPQDKNNFSPRVGFAYRLNDAGTLVARGGYGVYYDRISTRFANTQLFNFPYLAVGVGVFRPLATPFAAVPQPGAFPTAATVPGAAHAAWDSHQRRLRRPEPAHALRPAVQRERPVGVRAQLPARSRLRRVEGDEAAAAPDAQPARLQPHDQHLRRALRAVRLGAEERDRRVAERADQLQLALRLVADERDQALQQRPPFPLGLHLRQVD